MFKSSTIPMLFIIILTSNTMALGWQGHTEIRDDVIYVHNPSEPVTEMETVVLEELWRLDSDDDHVLGWVRTIEMDDQGLTYVLDSQLMEVAVYDGQGNWVRNMGREGDGPGEFRHPYDINLQPDGTLAVLQNRPSAIQMLDECGEPLPNLAVPERNDHGPYYFLELERSPQSTVVKMYQVSNLLGGGLTNLDFLSSIDENGEVLCHYFQTVDERRVGDNVRIEGEYGHGPLGWAMDSRGWVVQFIDHGQYELKIHRPDGTVDRIIHRDYESMVRDHAVFDGLQAYYDENYEGRNWRGNIGPIKYQVSEIHQDIQDVFFRPDGSLWVLTSRGSYGAPLGTLAVFDVFDQEGIFQRQVTLLGEGDYWADNFFLSRDCLFVVTNWGNEIPGWIHPAKDPTEPRGEREIICYRLP